MIQDARDTLTIVPDGKTHKRETPAGGVEIEASWKDLALQIKTKSPSGREVTQRFDIGDDGRLEVVTNFALPRLDDTVEIVTRYDEEKSK